MQTSLHIIVYNIIFWCFVIIIINAYDFKIQAIKQGKNWKKLWILRINILILKNKIIRLCSGCFNCTSYPQGSEKFDLFADII